MIAVIIGMALVATAYLITIGLTFNQTQDSFNNMSKPDADQQAVSSDKNWSDDYLDLSGGIMGI